MSLCLLDEKVRSRLRSGVAISSMAQCVGELVENAIDAGAKCIAVRVDISKYKIQVIDNGMGVAKLDLDLIGQRYATSKCHTLADLDHHLQHLGYRGEALASIVNCSGTVEISSRHHLSQLAYSKLFFHGNPGSVTPGSSQRPSIGTTVTVHDFFYNLPVRRRAMSAVLEMESIRQTLQGVALASHSVSFSLRNDQIGECVLQTRRTNSVLGTFSLLFRPSKASSMREASLKHSDFAITGYISTESHYNKNLQFIYVNKRLVKKTALHSRVNSLMANSLVVRCLSRQADLKWQRREYDTTSPRRNSDKHAVYVLMIKCSRSEYDVCLEPAKTLIEFRDWDLVLECLTQVVRQFLSEHKLTLGPEYKEDEDVEELECYKSSMNHEEEEEGEEGDEIDMGEEDEEDKGKEVEGTRLSSLSGFYKHVNQRLGGGDTKAANPLILHQKLKPSAVLDHHKISSSTASYSGRTTESRGSAVKASVLSQKRVPALHLDRPLRSPLSSHSVASKLASFLRKDHEKRNQECLPPHSTVSTGERHTEGQVHVSSLFPPKNYISSDSMRPDSAETQTSRTMTSGLSSSQLRAYPLTAVAVRPHTLVPQCNLHTSTSTSLPMNPVLSTTEDLVACTDGSRNLHNILQVSTSTSLSMTEANPVLGTRMITEDLAEGAGCSRSLQKNHQVSASTYLSNHLITKDLAAGTDGLQKNSTSTSLSNEDLAAGNLQVSTSTSLEANPILGPRMITKDFVASTDGSRNLHSNLQVSTSTALSMTEANPVLSTHLFMEDLAANTEGRRNWSLPNNLQDSTSASPFAEETGPVLMIVEDSGVGTDGRGSSQDVRSSETCLSDCFGYQYDMCTDSVPVVSENVARSFTHPPQALPNDLSTFCAVSSHGSGVENDRLYETSADGMRSLCGDPKSVWKETTDPLTAKKVYIHSKTGNSYTSKPGGHLPSTTLHSNPIHSAHAKGTSVIADDIFSSVVSNEDVVSTSYGAKPISAAPHLSHDFQCFLPGSKRLRVDDGATANAMWPVDFTGAVSDVAISRGEEEGEMEEGDHSVPPWDGGSFKHLLKNWKNPAFSPGQEGILNVGSSERHQIKVHNVINHYKFSKEMLDTVKILGQVDKKFIACVLDTKGKGEHNLLVLFDQHAAHERVRLEALQADLYESSSAPGSQLSIKSSKVHPPLLISLTPSEKRLVKTFQKQLEMLGVTAKEDGSGSVAIASLPAVLMEREASEIRRGRPAVALDLVQEMIIKHLQVLQATSGGSSAIPVSLSNVLNSQACHSAIKFGDCLTTDECSDLVQSLSKCKLPFQCAHGRPSLVPVLDLDVLKRKYPPQAEPSDLCKKLSAKFNV